jgi:hypothetical protein
MKIHEIANKISMKSPEVLSKAKELGLPYTGIGSVVSDEHTEILIKAFEGIEPTKDTPSFTEIVNSLPMALRQGSLIGIVHDGKQFNLVHTKMCMDQLERTDFEIISLHNTYYQAILELSKKLPQKLGIDSIKVFGK